MSSPSGLRLLLRRATFRSFSAGAAPTSASPSAGGAPAKGALWTSSPALQGTLQVAAAAVAVGATAFGGMYTALTQYGGVDAKLKNLEADLSRLEGKLDKVPELYGETKAVLDTNNKLLTGELKPRGFSWRW